MKRRYSPPALAIFDGALLAFEPGFLTYPANLEAPADPARDATGTVDERAGVMYRPSGGR